MYRLLLLFNYNCMYDLISILSNYFNYKTLYLG